MAETIERKPHTLRKGWVVALFSIAVLLAFLAGLWFPRSWLPGDLATHLPSSCSSTIARTRDLATQRHVSAAERREFRDMVDDRPDCFTDADRDALD